MAAIKVYGTPFSTATTRVLVTLHEKEVEYEFVPVDLRAGEHKKEPFLFLNPFGQVPAFEDGDLKLFESRAITKYIANQYADKGNQLACGDIKQKATMAVWIEAESNQFDPVASKLTRELVVNPVIGMPTDAAVVEEHEAKLAKVLDVYESRLAQSKYLACDCFTLADLYHIPHVYYLSGTQTRKLFDSRPHVSAWIADITARPSWSKVLAMQKH